MDVSLGDPQVVIQAQERQMLVEQIAYDTQYFIAGLIKAGMSRNDALNMGSFFAAEGYRYLCSMASFSIEKE